MAAEEMRSGWLITIVLVHMYSAMSSCSSDNLFIQYSFSYARLMNQTNCWVCSSMPASSRYDSPWIPVPYEAEQMAAPLGSYWNQNPSNRTWNFTFSLKWNVVKTAGVYCFASGEGNSSDIELGYSSCEWTLAWGHYNTTPGGINCTRFGKWNSTHINDIICNATSEETAYKYCWDKSTQYYTFYDGAYLACKIANRTQGLIYPIRETLGWMHKNGTFVARFFEFYSWNNSWYARDTGMWVKERCVNSVCLLRGNSSHNVTYGFPCPFDGPYCIPMLKVWNATTWLSWLQRGLQAPSGAVFVCGSSAYTSLPPKWKGSCYLAALVPPTMIYQQLPASKLRKSRYADSQWYLEHHIPLTFKKLQDWSSVCTLVLPCVGAVRIVGNAILHLQAVVESVANDTAQVVSAIQAEVSQIQIVGLQHRMALDTILASKGGTCALIGTACCVYISDKTNETNPYLQNKKDVADVHMDEPTEPNWWDWFLSWMPEFGWLEALIYYGCLFGFFDILCCLCVPFIQSCCYSAEVSVIQLEHV